MFHLIAAMSSSFAVTVSQCRYHFASFSGSTVPANYHEIAWLICLPGRGERSAHVSHCAYRSIHNPSLHVLKLLLEKPKSEETLDDYAFANVCDVFWRETLFCSDLRVARPSLYSIPSCTLECACACRWEKELFNCAEICLSLGFLKFPGAPHSSWHSP